MPEISRFFGLVVKMFFDDHNLPHFHVEFQEYRAIVDVHKAELHGRTLTNEAVEIGTGLSDSTQSRIA